jgi:hypothetical protein
MATQLADSASQLADSHRRYADLQASSDLEIFVHCSPVRR